VPTKPLQNASGIIQATILKKCDRAIHRPQTRKACAAGSCQHTCEPWQVQDCPHKWTVRYSVNSRQREASFATLTEAQVFQADLSMKKVTPGVLFTRPRAVKRLDNRAETREVLGHGHDDPHRPAALPAHAEHLRGHRGVLRRHDPPPRLLQAVHARASNRQGKLQPL